MSLSSTFFASKKTENIAPVNPEMLKMIAAKRNGQAHSGQEIFWLINNLSSIPDYQLTSWLMAVCINGLNSQETKDLTQAMAYSGHVLTLKRHELDSTTNRGFVDKHSTGGVGDKVTLALTPILAALGFKVSKFAGRALGHTGGTIDKLESIPGFKTDLDMKRFEKQIEQIGVALASQSIEFAPADKRLYSLRDRSGTVESLPLIASSVMSKKIAGGADIILLDVKVGSGAFMKDLGYAKKLAKQMVEIGTSLNLNTKAIISNMNQPLGTSVGTTLEVLEAIELLEGKNEDSDFYELVFELAGTLANAVEIKDVIRTGKAYVKFEEWISAQGGDITKIKSKNEAKYKLDIKANKIGWVKELDAFLVGQAAHRLAYKPKSDGTYQIDHSAGVILKAKIGEKVIPSDILFTLYGNNQEELDIASKSIYEAYLFSDHKIKKPKLILSRI